MALPASGGNANISFSAIYIELGMGTPGLDEDISIAEAATGIYAAINTNSASYPNASQPHGVGEWGSYDHSAASPPIASFTLTFNGTICRTDKTVTLTDTSTGGTNRAWEVTGGDRTVSTGTLGNYAIGTGGSSTVELTLDEPETVYTINLKAYNTGGTDIDTKTQGVSGYTIENYSASVYHAYSFRKLNADVTNCMIVRRSSDSNELTVGFDDDGFLDTAAIDSWSASDTIYVKQWYDQSGNNDHMTGVTASQPRLRNGATYEVDSFSNKGMYFDGINDYLEATNTNGITGTTTRTFYGVGQCDQAYNSGSLVMYGVRGTTTATNNATWWRVTHEPAVRGFGAIEWENATNNYNKTNSQLGSITYGGGTYADHTLWWNGGGTAITVVGTPTAVSLATAGVYKPAIGWDLVNSNWWVGNISEIIIYETEHGTTTREAIEDDILAEYAGI